MINIADISINKISLNKFRVVSPGNTRFVTSFEGISCLLMACGKNDFHSIYEDLDSSLKNKVNLEAVETFLKQLLELNILYKTNTKHISPFNISGIKKGLNEPNFRSISELNICPSSACNLKCNYCNLHQGGHSIKIDRIKKCLNEAIDFGLNIVNILGGEPCMFSQEVEQIIKECHTLNIERITVSSNGILMNKNIAKLWADAGLRTLQISTDLYKGKGKSFEINKEAIKIACDYFKEVSVAYVYYGQDNEKNLRPIIDELKDYPVRVDLKFEVPYENTKQPINAIDISRFAKDWEIYTDGGPIITPPESGLKEIVFCGAGNSQAFINPNGEIKPCGFLKKSIGNLNNNNFKEIWLNRDWSYYQKAKRVRQKKCIDCEYQIACIGGCLAKFNSRQKNCIYNSVLSEEVNNSRCFTSIPK